MHSSWPAGIGPGPGTRSATGQTLRQTPQLVQRVLIQINSCDTEMPSGLWHHAQRRGQPFRKTVVRIPGPSLTEYFWMLNTNPVCEPRTAKALAPQPPHCKTASNPRLGLAPHFLLIRTVQVEIDTAQGPITVTLADNNGDMLVQRDAVTVARLAVFVCFEGLLNERNKCKPAFFGCLFKTNNVLVIHPKRFFDFFFEHFRCHRRTK